MSKIVEQRARRDPEPGRVVMSCWAFGRVGDTLVMCTQGDHGPPDAEVERYLERLTIPDFSAILLHTRGGHPTPKQRARIAAFWEASGRTVPRVAVLDDSRVARAVLTAMQWIMRTLNIKAFPSDAVVSALQWLHADAPPIVVSEAIASMDAALRLQADKLRAHTPAGPPR